MPPGLGDDRGDHEGVFAALGAVDADGVGVGELVELVEGVLTSGRRPCRSSIEPVLRVDRGDGAGLAVEDALVVVVADRHDPVADPEDRGAGPVLGDAVAGGVEPFLDHAAELGGAGRALAHRAQHLDLVGAHALLARDRHGRQVDHPLGDRGRVVELLEPEAAPARQERAARRARIRWAAWTIPLPCGLPEDVGQPDARDRPPRAAGRPARCRARCWAAGRCRRRAAGGCRTGWRPSAGWPGCRSSMDASSTTMRSACGGRSPRTACRPSGSGCVGEHPVHGHRGQAGELRQALGRLARRRGERHPAAHRPHGRGDGLRRCGSCRSRDRRSGWTRCWSAPC